MKVKSCLLALVLILTSTTVWAQPKIDVALKAETEVKKMVDGKEVVTRSPAKESSSGQTIFYTLTCSNNGTTPASRVKVIDPVPSATQYLPGTAYGENSEITFSIDGGKNYKKPALLSYKIKRDDGSMEDRLASPEEYTHIQWEISRIDAGSQVSVGFQAVVK